MEFISLLFLLVALAGVIWSLVLGWEDGLLWFCFMLFCQVGIPIWYILKWQSGEGDLIKMPAGLWLGGVVGYALTSFVIGG